MTDERWLPVVGYEGYYEVSDCGNVRSVDRWIPMGKTTRFHKGKPLSPSSVTKYGHLTVSLWKADRGKRVLVHRLVLTTFVDACPEGMECCHNDGDPSNNHVSNLRWDTRSENIRDAVRQGTHNSTRKTICARSHEYDEANTRRDDTGQRICRKCVVENGLARPIRTGVDPPRHGTVYAHRYYSCRCDLCCAAYVASYMKSAAKKKAAVK